MIQVSGLKKSYGARVLFEDVSFSISSREIIGLVGRNGCGKSTLFKILRETESSDAGTVHVPKGYKLGFLDQHIKFTEDTVLKECCTALLPDQINDHYRAEAFLFGLGFTKEDMERSPSEFSGGYQLRMNLVKALLQEPDLLMLDEPTNYLDILSLNWLRGFLKSFQGEVMIITHDRHFMDSVTTHTMGIHRQSLRKIKGSTEKFYEQIMLDEEIYEKTRVNTEKKVKEMQQFVDRFKAKATKAKQAQSKMKKIEKMTVLSALMKESQLGFKFNYKSTPAKTLLRAKGLSFGYKKNEPLFSNLSFKVDPGECIAVIGKNGYGKTTLLNVVSEQLKGEGEITGHPDLTIGYYQQTNKKKLDPKFSVYEEISSENIHLGISQVRAICGAMMFPGDDAEKKIGVLSGGEQGRVLLGKVIAKSCNLLLLDEPTNHLDMESIQIMTEEVQNFEGGVLLVTHDEDLLHKLATQLIVFKNNKAYHFLGTYEEFLEKDGWEEDVVKQEKKSKGDRKENKRKRAEVIQQRSKKLKPLKSKVEKIENEIMEKEDFLKTANQEIEEQGIDSDRSKALFKEIGSVQIKVVSLYEEMDQLIESMDQINLESDKLLEEYS